MLKRGVVSVLVFFVSSALLFITGCQRQEQDFHSFNSFFEDGNITFQVVFPDMEVHSGLLELRVSVGSEEIYTENLEVSESDFEEVGKCTPQFCGTYMMYEHSVPISLEDYNYTSTAEFDGEFLYSSTVPLEVFK